MNSIDDAMVQKIATIAVESYIRALEDEGLLKQSAEVILTKYSIVSYRRGFWGRFVEKFFKIDQSENENIWFRTVKHIIHTNEDPVSGPGKRNNVLSLVSSEKTDKS
jgi:hypothetical protein